MASTSTPPTATATEPTKKILLKCSDGEEFEIEEIVAVQSQTIKHMIEDDCANNVIPLPNVTGRTMAKVIVYCMKHAENTTKSESSSDSTAATDGADDLKLKEWDTEFAKLHTDELFDLVLAANYLNIKSLLDLTCQTVADLIKDYTPEEVRKIFNITNDFTPEEEEKVRAEHPWVFEK